VRGRIRGGCESEMLGNATFGSSHCALRGSSLDFAYDKLD